MAKKDRSLEEQAHTWKELSLILLLLLGIVGALSYTLLFRQKDEIQIQEMRIFRLQEQVDELNEKVETQEAK